MNPSGLHDFATVDVDDPEQHLVSLSEQRRTRSQIGPKKTVILGWDKDVKTPAVVDNPVKFERMPHKFNEFVARVWRARAGDEDALSIFAGGQLDLVHPGYYKAHLQDTAYLLDLVRDHLPPKYMVKKQADQKAIVFFNETDGQSPTHYDRDTSILLMICGHKQIFMAKPNAKVASSLRRDTNQTLFPEVDPFASGSEEGSNEGFDWELIELGSLDAYLLPKDFIHCVRSTAGTIAISLQVERNHHGDD